MLPKPAEIAREAIIVMAGAIAAAWIIGQFPGVRRWIGDQWRP